LLSEAKTLNGFEHYSSCARDFSNDLNGLPFLRVQIDRIKDILYIPLKKRQTIETIAKISRTGTGMFKTIERFRQLVQARNHQKCLFPYVGPGLQSQPKTIETIEIIEKVH